MDLPYPPAPAEAPPDLTRPTAAFRRQAWAAVLALFLFLALYFGLAAWFGRIAWRGVEHLLAGVPWFFAVVEIFTGGFLFALMLKGLFFIRRASRTDLVEVTEAEQPLLLAFVRQIAADAGAPRPHRVFLSARVNAAVFYDVSLWNLIVPSRKNLEIGAGLVNALSLDELKAVVAHEFGHFAQRTMSVGAWVHISQQFVGALVARRDGFDRFLDGLSHQDLRIAWIGWVMRLVVWSLRAVFDTAFRGLILVERALSRQMEFQADLVSVSLAGSDSLVHALHRLGAADDAWDRAFAFSCGETQAGRRVGDLFAVQERVLDKMGGILGEPAHGRTPPRPADPGHRLFRSGIAETPRMWSSHPANHEREENAKRRYLPSVLDPRPAWSVFRDPEGVRRRVTEHLLGQTFTKLPADVPVADTLGRLDESFGRPRLDPRFRGAFLREPLLRHARDASQLAGAHPPDPQAVLERAYPPSLRADLTRCRELEEEKDLLEGLHDGVLQPPDGVLRFRGDPIRRRDLPRCLAQVARELDAARGAVEEHDRSVRAAHLAAARRLGRGWEEHLAGLLALAHYAEHAKANLEDARGHVQHVLAIVTADQKVSETELQRLIGSASDAAFVLERTMSERSQVVLAAPVAERLGSGDWNEVIGDLALGAPEPEDFSQGWLGAMDDCVDQASGAMTRLRNAALDALVQAEAHVEACLRGGDPGDAPRAASAPRDFTRLCPGDERPRQKRLDWWDRFQTADGVVAGTARLAVAAAVLAPLLYFL